MPGTVVPSNRPDAIESFALRRYLQNESRAGSASRNPRPCDAPLFRMPIVRAPKQLRKRAACYLVSKIDDDLEFTEGVVPRRRSSSPRFEAVKPLPFPAIDPPREASGSKGNDNRGSERSLQVPSRCEGVLASRATSFTSRRLTMRPSSIDSHWDKCNNRDTHRADSYQRKHANAMAVISGARDQLHCLGFSLSELTIQCPARRYRDPQPRKMAR